MGIGMITKDSEQGSGGPRVSAGNGHDRHRRGQPARSRPAIERIGRLARGGYIPLGYYKDPEKTARLFVEVDGKRYTVPGDFARHEADGTITLLGRGNTCVNTGGEKVFPEEVEAALMSHPDVFDVLVVGVPDERLGQAVAAVVEPRPGTDAELRRADARTCARRSPATRCRKQHLARRQGPPPRHRQGATTAGPTTCGHRPPGGCPVRTELCDQLGINHPIFAFTPSEHVAAAVSRAGGLGVLGCVRFNDAEELDEVLNWMDDNTDGKPYGVDIVMPAKVPTEGTATDLGAVHPRRAHGSSSRRPCASSACRRCPTTTSPAARVCSAGCTRWRARTSTSRSSTDQS